MSAAIQVFGIQAMMSHYAISQGDWTTISAHWQSELSRDPMNLAVRRNQIQEQEAARLRAGGQPMNASVQRSAAGSPQFYDETARAVVDLVGTHSVSARGHVARYLDQPCSRRRGLCIAEHGIVCALSRWGNV